MAIKNCKKCGSEYRLNPYTIEKDDGICPHCHSEGLQNIYYRSE